LPPPGPVILDLVTGPGLTWIGARNIRIKGANVKRARKSFRFLSLIHLKPLIFLRRLVEAENNVEDNVKPCIMKGEMKKKSSRSMMGRYLLKSNAEPVWMKRNCAIPKKESTLMTNRMHSKINLCLLLRRR